MTFTLWTSSQCFLMRHVAMNTALDALSFLGNAELQEKCNSKPYQWSAGLYPDCRWPWGEGGACVFLAPLPPEWSSWQLCCRYARRAGTLEPAWTPLLRGGSQRYASWEDVFRDVNSTHGGLYSEHHGRSEPHSLWGQREASALSIWSRWLHGVWVDAGDTVPVVPPPAVVLADITPG